MTDKPDNVKRAQTTLAQLTGNGGRLTEEQSAKFCDYLVEVIEEENKAWFAATWKQRLWYRVKLVYWRVRGWSRTPFNVKVYKFKSKGMKKF